MPATASAMINIPQRLFVDCDGTAYPITNCFNAEGGDCEPDEAIAAVAGEGGLWFTILLREFERGTVQ